VIYGSVCSGIEAATVAWHPLGWRASFVSEIEAFPRAVLQHRWPEIPLHGDFTTISRRDYESIDLLVGGTPCQSFSVAGLRGGLDDERGNLALEYLRLADRLRPRWLVWENVPGVLSSDGGRDFGAILGGMVELGYGFAYRVLDAQFFGVAQRRRRVFVVGYLGDWRRAAAVLFERHSLQGHPAPRRDKGPGVAVSPSLRAQSNSSHREDSQAFVAAALRARDHARGVDSDCTDTLIAHALRGEGFDASEDGTGRGTPLVPVCFSSKDHGADALSDLAPTLRAGGHDGSHANAGVPPAIAFALRGREGGAMPEVGGDQVGSLRAASGGSSRDYVAFNSREDCVSSTDVFGSLGSSLPQSQAVAGSAVRRLTPRECERLQGFADDYTLIPWRKGMAPDGPRYKALGNSMAVPVMAWIGRRIEMVDAIASASEAA
jgi:DNA (cytosine-5)-methyltransferase 1